MKETNKRFIFQAIVNKSTGAKKIGFGELSKLSPCGRRNKVSIACGLISPVFSYIHWLDINKHILYFVEIADNNH